MPLVCALTNSDASSTDQIGPFARDAGAGADHVAEELHRRLFAAQRNIGRRVAAQARSMAEQAIEPLGQPVQRAVREALGHLGEPSYRQRLEALAQAGQRAVPGVTGDVNRWTSKIVNARNAFAHRLPKPPPDAARVDEWLAVTASLRWLLTGPLLLETGVAPEVMAGRGTG